VTTSEFLNVTGQRFQYMRAEEEDSKAVPPHAMKALGGKGIIAPTHS
jgi:hypothetical protein